MAETSFPSTAAMVMMLIIDGFEVMVFGCGVTVDAMIDDNADDNK